MSTLALILVAAGAAWGIARGLRASPLPWLVLAGIGVGAFGAALEAPVLDAALRLGLAFLVFFAGTELDPRRLGAHRWAAVWIAAAQFGVVGGASLVVALGLGVGTTAAAYLALALTASSTLVVVDLLRQRRQVYEAKGRIVLGALLLQDLVVVVLIAVVGGLDDGARGVAMALAGTAGLMGIAAAALRWGVPWLLERLEGDDEAQLLTALAVLFGFLGAGHGLGLDPVVGAFLAGVALSGFPAVGLVRAQLTSFADFFQAVFFVALGAILSVPSWHGLALGALLAAAIVVATPPLVIATLRALGARARTAVESGLLLAQCSEFSLIVGWLGVQRGHIDERLLGVLSAVTVVTMLLTPFLSHEAVVWRLLHALRAEREGPGSEPPEGHVLLIGGGGHGRALLDRLRAAGRAVAVIDEDAAVVRALREDGVPAWHVEGSAPRVLRAAGVRGAAAVVSHMRRLSDNQRLLRLARGCPAYIRVFSPEEASRIAAAGGRPVLVSEAAADALLARIGRADEA